MAWSIETGEVGFNPRLQAMQEATDDALFEIYERTLSPLSAELNRTAPVHQLFYHRLTGGRLDRFYGEGTQITWQGRSILLQDLRKARWVINGRVYPDTLDDLIADAITMLNPAQSSVGVVGHGDAHNGNVFYCPDKPLLTYFDPAFAGTHHPLLDLTKPLFHNVFAMWMYHSQYFAERINVSLRIDGNTWYVDHDFPLHPIREMFLESKSQRVLLPILRLMRDRDMLQADWRTLLKFALMCCPLLTMNLADAGRFPESIALLGFSMAVEMGSSSLDSPNRIDALLDRATV